FALDVVLALPALVLAMALAAALGPSLFNSMLAVAIVRIPAYVRVSIRKKPVTRCGTAKAMASLPLPGRICNLA
ncbi:unnamed protein product, partial [marine sediment metagenome]